MPEKQHRPKQLKTCITKIPRNHLRVNFINYQNLKVQCQYCFIFSIHIIILITTGGLSVAVPGELMGYWEAHKRFGRLEWKELIEPTIELCKKGSIITEYLGAILKTKEAEILAEPTMAEILIDPKTNKVLKVSFNQKENFISYKQTQYFCRLVIE